MIILIINTAQTTNSEFIEFIWNYDRFLCLFYLFIKQKKIFYVLFLKYFTFISN